MSQDYREETNTARENKMRAILKEAPSYVRSFSDYMSTGKRELRTQEAYLFDVMEFVTFEQKMLRLEAPADVTIEIIDELSQDDIQEYRTQLRRVRMNSASSIKRKLSSLSVFFKFLYAREYIDVNPMTGVELPAINERRIIRIDKEQSSLLLSGILANDRYLYRFYRVGNEEFSDLKVVCNRYQVSCSEAKEWAKENQLSLIYGVSHLIGEDIVEESRVDDISEEIRKTREPVKLRNYAIVSLFLASGIRISELVGLDLRDVNLSDGCITVILKGGDEKRVYFHSSVSKILRAYINGTDPEKLFSEDGTVLGRGDLLKSRKRCDALFLSTRGTRMSTRSIELMVKEMVQTYLPDYDDRNTFHVHSLRASCASRILLETGNVALASSQLNHKSTAVTSKFYAQLTEEQTRAEVAKLKPF